MFPRPKTHQGRTQERTLCEIERALAIERDEPLNLFHLFIGGKRLEVQYLDFKLGLRNDHLDGSAVFRRERRTKCFMPANDLIETTPQSGNVEYATKTNR